MTYQNLIIYGYEVPYGTFTEDDARLDYYPKEQTSGDVVIVSDGKRGNYSSIGVLQYKTERSSDSLPKIEPQSFEEPTQEEIIELHRVIWKGFELDNLDGMPEHYVITHIT